MTALVLVGEFDWPDQWLCALRTRMPTLDVRRWPEAGDPGDIEYALVWQPPGKVLSQFPRLRVVFSLGAGLDHLSGPDSVPPGIPVVRMVEDALTEGMSEYVLYNVLRFHRGFDEYERRRASRTWEPHPQQRPRDCVVGIMGVGVLGSDAARKLVALDFSVRGWSRNPREIPGVQSFSGVSSLPEFLAGTQILVCLLPLTAQTRGILDSSAFQALPRGAYVINAGRGGHLVEQDLIDALDSGQLAGAALDVFTTEPLPREHPFWGDERIALTPHVASLTNPVTAAEHICAAIEGDRSGGALAHVFDPARGY